jgi:cupin 2 domain-containing protein
MTELQRGRLQNPGAAPVHGEVMETVAVVSGVRIEQILSGELASPGDYVQDHDEWAVVLAGGAVLRVEHETVTLSTGEWVLLPSGVPHRLVSTIPDTSWLVVRGPTAPGRGQKQG